MYAHPHARTVNNAHALREIGFEEDRTASACIECQGTFKQQHDTDKNLKTLQVFPRVELPNVDGGGAAGAEAEARQDLSDLGSPGYLATMCTFATFQKMVSNKTQAWAQRRRLLSELKDMATKFKEIEDKMIQVQPLTPEEQELYDATSVEDIMEKVTWLERHMKSMVDAGQLTMGEKQQLLDQVEQRIGALGDELDAARAAEKPKRVERLEAQLETLSARQAKIGEIVPVRHPLKHEDEIMKLRMEWVPLHQLESTSGRLLTMDEMRKLGAKPHLEEQISSLEEQSRNWFEDDAEFQARCSALTAAATRKLEKAQKASAKKKSGASEWQTVSSMGSSSSRGKSKKR